MYSELSEGRALEIFPQRVNLQIAWTAVTCCEFLEFCLISQGDFEMNTLDLQSRALNKHDLPVANSSENWPIDLMDL